MVTYSEFSQQQATDFSSLFWRAKSLSGTDDIKYSLTASYESKIK